MKSLAFSQAAQADLGNVWRYSAGQWSPEQADRYADGLREACRDLAAGLGQGRPVAVRRGYLRYAIGSHATYYRERGDRLEVIRILHQAQDARRNLRG